MVSRLRRLAGKLAGGSAGRASSTVDDRSARSSSDARGPSLLELRQDGAATRLLISQVTDLSENPLLLLVGRKSKLSTSIPLTADVRGRSAAVEAEHLAIFGSETVDVLVIDTPEDLSQRRRRLEAPAFVPPPALGRRHRWFATTEGNLSIRPRSDVELIAESGVFDENHYRAQTSALPADIDPIEHYVAKGAAEGLNPSEMFDTTYYRQLNPRVRRRNPLAHYCDEGWREMFNPSPRFDTWWYWAKHLDLADDSTNPLAHWQAVGRHEELTTVPDSHPSRRLSDDHSFDPQRRVRRVCLFAAYDPDGMVDEYVVDYVSELAKYADVFYLADREMPESELAKLDDVTMGAWGMRHGQYDFGSYARLADLVGWNTIEQYDELLLVNDSCYLLRPLDDVFSRMDGKSCHWWGLQATKGIYQTRREPANQFREPISMESVRSVLVDRFEQDYVYDFLVGSFFVAYRKPVIDDPEFRRYLHSVATEPTKRHIVKKYEIGLTRWLIQHGHSFDTYMSRLFPFHPVFTRWYFRMVDDGFPVLKRFFLSDNLYRAPGLAEWPKLITDRIPAARVDVFERNLVRVTDPDKLRASLDIGGPTGVEDLPALAHPLSRTEFIQADVLSPKHAGWWAFPVDESTGAFIGNVRALFEHVKDDPSIHKIVLTRGTEVAGRGVSVEVVALESAEGQHRLMRAGTIVIERDVDASIIHPVSSELHNLIRVGRNTVSADSGGLVASSDDLRRRSEQQERLRAAVCSSVADALAVAAASYPLTVHQIWNTGLPANDFILRAEDDLPRDLAAELAELRTLVGDRRLVLFMPTFRNAQGDGYGRFSADEIAWLDTWLRSNNCVLGVREHMADSARLSSAQLAVLPILDLSNAEFCHPEMLYRESAALITDDSSALIDYLLTGKPTLSFAYDHEFDLLERGGFYDLDFCFPGPICKNFTDLQTALGEVFDREPDNAYEFRRRLFFDHVDDHSSARVVEKIRDLTTVHGIGKWPGEYVA